MPKIGKAKCFTFLTGHYGSLVQHYCVGISISEEHTGTIFRSEAHFTAADGQLYSRYPQIILHSCTVNTHQSYRTPVQSVPTNHTA